MIQIFAISLAAALLLAIATGSANAQSKSKGADISPWTVTHGGSQKKPGKVLKAKPKTSKSTLSKGWPAKVGN